MSNTIPLVICGVGIGAGYFMFLRSLIDHDGTAAIVGALLAVVSAGFIWMVV